MLLLCENLGVLWATGQINSALPFLLQALTGSIYCRFLYAGKHVISLARIAGFTPILVLKGGHYHGVLEGLNPVSQPLNNMIEVTPPENPESAKLGCSGLGSQQFI